MIFGGAIARIYGTVWRKCPQCGSRQEIPALKRSKTLNCKYCGATMDASHNEAKIKDHD
ncbi:MAG: hypothetical protein ABIR70_22180 [Bryobacteraceae bacterium]